ncbi:MAG: acetate/propionate family kinase [Vibrio sp.]
MHSQQHVLVLNCGSSSLKFCVLPEGADSPILSGLAERLGLEDGVITFKYNNQENHDQEKQTHTLTQSTHHCAIETLFAELKKLDLLDSIFAIGHRVAHGGNKFNQSVLLTKESIEGIRDVTNLAPLHNPANLIGIETALEILPSLPQVAVFDTAFHQTLPPEAYTYAIPLEYQEKHHVRRYGFHGTSHRFIASQTIEKLQLDPENNGILIAHLGNGSSVCAVKNSKSVDTSMGMTPLEGLVMGTRCGDIDFGAINYLADETGQSLADLYRMANSQSGMLGLSGISSDNRAIEQAHHEGNARATLALNVMAHRLARHLAAHMASLDKVDALVFTGGIGENSALVRELTVKKLNVFGFKLDNNLNLEMRGGNQGKISTEDSIGIYVMATNEEKVIANDAAEIARAV